MITNMKNTLYENLGGGTGLSFADIALILLIACFIGLYIFMIYRLTSKTAFYSKDLNVTLVGMVIVVAAIMIAMQSNLIVSLGMIGALSIVRFRNAVKNPRDLLFLFWAVSAGIICGVGLKLLGIILCVVMTLMLLILELIPNAKAPALLVLRSGEDEPEWEQIKTLLKKHSKYIKEKSRNIQRNQTEVIFEIRVKNEEELIKELKAVKALSQISLLTHDGEFRG